MSDALQQRSPRYERIGGGYARLRREDPRIARRLHTALGDGERERGGRELRRVARGPIAIVTFDRALSARLWLIAEYLPEVVELDRRIMPTIDEVAGWLGGVTGVETLPVARDTPDWSLAAVWGHPERVLDPAARAATSGFARMRLAVVRRVQRELRRDLSSGEWDRRHGHLRELDEYDARMRLLINPPAQAAAA